MSFIESIKEYSSVNQQGVEIVPFIKCREIGEEHGLSPRAAEIEALEGGVCPSRYERNIGTIGLDGQIALLRARVAVIGCGGLGGYVVEMLARAGVGRLILIDGDVFSENNINRQILCTERALGIGKAVAAKHRVAEINGAVEVISYDSYIDAANARELLKYAEIAVDALDSNAARKIVFDACAELGIPFVHGAIAGFWAQAGVFYPGDETPWKNAPNSGIETETGNPPFTPAFAAAVEVCETIKTLLNKPNAARAKLLWYDLAECVMMTVELGENKG